MTWVWFLVIALGLGLGAFYAIRSPTFVAGLFAIAWNAFAPKLFKRNKAKEKELSSATREGRETKDGKAHGHGGENR